MQTSIRFLLECGKDLSHRQPNTISSFELPHGEAAVRRAQTAWASTARCPLQRERRIHDFIFAILGGVTARGRVVTEKLELSNDEINVRSRALAAHRI